MTNSVNLLGFGAVGLLVAVGCSSSRGSGAGGGGGAETAWTNPENAPPPWASTIARTDTCTQTACEHSYQACKEQEAECWSQCSLVPDYAAECASACSNISCSSCSEDEDDDDCALYSYQFAIKTEPDPALLTACKAAVARDQGCGEAHLEADCEHFARLEDPQYAGVYSCVAATPCGGDVGACLDAIPPVSTTHIFAEEFNSICANQYVMEPEQVAALATDLSWMRLEVRVALFACTDTYYCENVIACEEAWFAVVFPQT